jgi:hypothetical protein
VSDEADRRSILHAVRLRSLLDVDALAARTGCDASIVREVLVEAASAGWVVERTGRMSGWSLTTAGRGEGMRLLAVELDELGARPVVEAAYRRFLEVNDRFLEVCTRWQLRPVDGEHVPNDHLDPGHDEAVLRELDELHAVVVPEVVVPAGRAVARFARYAARFDHARARLGAGDLDWFTRPMIDSYHTIWFELHDDLLATLGLERADERRRQGADAPEPVRAAPSPRGQTGGVGAAAGPADEE